MAYVPNFTPSPTPCLAPSFIEHRSRCSAGGTFFRSKDQGDFNDLSIVVTVTNVHTTPTDILDDVHCEVSKDGVVIETYDVEQTATYETSSTPAPDPDDPPIETSGYVYHSSGFINLRAAINGNVDSVIQMPAREYDVEDSGTDPDEMISFSGTFAGGVGGPTDGSGIDSIRTGPTVTLIILRSTEDDQGNNITPSPARRIQKWDGAQWTTFTPSPT